MKNGIDVTIYSKPEFNWSQMHIIRIGLEEGLDVSSYANSDYKWKEMDKIRKNMKKS